MERENRKKLELVCRCKICRENPNGMTSSLGTCFPTREARLPCRERPLRRTVRSVSQSYERDDSSSDVSSSVTEPRSCGIIRPRCRDVSSKGKFDQLIETLETLCGEMSHWMNGANNVGTRERRHRSLDNRTKKVKFTFRDIEDSLEKFDGIEGQNIIDWLAEFEEQSNVFEWDNDEKLVYARRLLSGPAKLFVNHDLKPKTWRRLKHGLMCEFEQEIDTMAIHRKLSKMKKRNAESYNEFCYRVRKLAAPAKLDQKTIISYIVEAVGETTDSKLFLSEASSMGELKEKLRLYENYMNRDLFGSRGDGPRCFGCKNHGHVRANCPDEKASTKKTINTIHATTPTNAIQETENNKSGAESEEDSSEECLWESSLKEHRNAFKNFLYGYRK